MAELTPDDVTQVRRQNTFFRDLTRRITEWGEILASLPARLELLEIAVRESSEDEANAVKELRQQVKRLEELWLLRETGREDSAEAKRHKATIRDDHSVEDLEAMRATMAKSLHWAQMKKARAGLNVDLSALHEIEEFTAAIAEIDEQLDKLKNLKKKKR